jgi:lysophospholipase L1-like esterase
MSAPLRLRATVAPTLMLLALVSPLLAWAPPCAATPTQKGLPSTQPIVRNVGWWWRRHHRLLAGLEKGPRLLFVGDSITARWERQGKIVWQRFYGRRRAANFGIGADETGHVLWRLKKARLQRFADQIEVAVLMIGTNNVYQHSARQVSRGIVAIVDLLQKKLPETEIVVLAIFPRGHKPNIYRRKVARASRYAFAKLRGRKRVHLLDIGRRFLAKRRRVLSRIMPDYIHLSEEGYRRWAHAIEPKLSALLCDGRPKRSPVKTSEQPTLSKRPRPDAHTLRRYDRWTRQAAKRYGIDWLLAKAVRLKESFNDPVFVSTTGAVGLMQLMPIGKGRQYLTASYRAYLAARKNRPKRRFRGKSARQWGLLYQKELLQLVERLANKSQKSGKSALTQKEVRFDPRWNIEHGTAHLANDLQRFRKRYPRATRRQLLRMTLAAYYAGSARVRFKNRRVIVPRYTHHYLKDTLAIYCRLKRGLPGR